MQRRIVKNSIKCKRCGEIIVSTSVHDYVTCKCGACSVDGGNEYLRRAFMYSQEDIIEMSEFEETD